MYKKYFKRLFDLCSSGMALLFLSPLLLYIAYLVKVKLGSPVLFTQIRPGKDNRLFKMYKFRTMYPDAEERKKELMEQNRVKDGMMFKMDFDPRIIGNKILSDGTKKESAASLERQAWMNSHSFSIF